MKIHTISNKVKSQTTFIFIHGNSSSSSVFQTILNSDLPYSLLAFDLPGHGKSAFSMNITDYSLEHYKQVLLTQVKQQTGDIILVGNSLGGHIAIEIAPHIANLKGLIIMGTPPVKRPLNIEEAITANESLPVFLTAKSTNDDIEKAIRIAVVNKNVRKNIITDFNNTDPKVRTAISKDLTNDCFANEYEIFHSLTCRKLIIQGKQEPTVSTLYLSTLAKTAGAELKIIDKCGHYPTIEQPQKTIQLLKDFAKQCGAS
ncbi:MAG: alpha/beta hydrolase [Colwellia sp.]|nr:alpha/beta hydrolase [Colwellia sp.]